MFVICSLLSLRWLFAYWPRLNNFFFAYIIQHTYMMFYDHMLSIWFCVALASFIRFKYAIWKNTNASVLLRSYINYVFFSQLTCKTTLKIVKMGNVVIWCLEYTWITLKIEMNFKVFIKLQVTVLVPNNVLLYIKKQQASEKSFICVVKKLRSISWMPTAHICIDNKWEPKS